MRVRGSMRAFAVRNPNRQPVDGAGEQEREQLPACHIGNQPPARKKTAMVFAQFKPDADRLGRIVLEQHWYTPKSARRERVGKCAAHDHVARLIDLAEQAGVALDGAIGIDRCSWCKYGGDGRFG
jgi:hypothetical protein